MKTERTARFVTMCFVWVVLSLSTMAGCDEESENDNIQSTERENTLADCDDGEDNDEDGATDCDDDECTPFDICTLTTEPDISGMPVPPVDDVPKPAGAAENLVVLDWAGFTAAVSYTFDDSHDSHIEHYDALQETGARVTFFVVNDTATDTNGWRRAVEDGHELGNHTAHHCHAGLNECAFGTPLESAAEEIGACSDLIIEAFGQEGVWTLAAPYGEPWWGMQAANHVFLNRCVNSGTIAPGEAINPFSLPSIMLPGGADAETIITDMDDAYDNGEWLIFCLHAILPTQNASSGGVHIDAITDSIAHGQALEDLWIDSMVNVGAYWMGQKVLADATSKKNGDETDWTWHLPDHFPPGKYLRVTVDGGTLSQNGEALAWSSHGYYEVSLDKGVLTLTP